MSCQATRILIDISIQCLKSQMYLNSESCLKLLLDISVSNSPNYDWVIAHIGNCFPHIFIDKILLSGLKNYILMSTEHKDKKNEVKLMSFIGILDHLSGSHFSIMSKAVLTLFMVM